MNHQEKLVIALDVDSRERAVELAKELAPHVGMFKVGMELFYACGPEIVSDIQKHGGKVFVDLKLHDIPNTVSRAACVLTRYGASMINVHASGGRKMMESAAGAVADEAARLGIELPRLIAVTVLTSTGQEEFNVEMGIDGNIQDTVKAWAKMAKESGLDGVVASAREAQVIRETCGGSFDIVTPGIRPADSGSGDQKRIVTPGDALRAGATHLVVGRPVVAAPEPVAAAKNVLAEMC